MKPYYLTVYLVLFCLFTSFKPNKACEYAGSNLSFVSSQTKRAIKVDDINQARYFTYRALNAIEKSKKQLEACGCEYAEKSIASGLENLKKATKAHTLNGTRLLLKRALDDTLGSLEALDKHELHGTTYASDVLVMNTIESTDMKMKVKPTEGALLYQKIDASLLNYEESLNKIITTVNCKEASAFANRVYKNCEAELLKPNLSEGRKYYNLKTKEITKSALERLGECK